MWSSGYFPAIINFWLPITETKTNLLLSLGGENVYIWKLQFGVKWRALACGMRSTAGELQDLGAIRWEGYVYRTHFPANFRLAAHRAIKRNKTKCAGAGAPVAAEVLKSQISFGTHGGDISTRCPHPRSALNVICDDTFPSRANDDGTCMRAEVVCGLVVQKHFILTVLKSAKFNG